MPLMVITGVLLAVHFDTWSVSVNLTSLAHSLLFVSTTPFVLIVVALFRYGGALIVSRKQQEGSNPTSARPPLTDDDSVQIVAASAEQSVDATVLSGPQAAAATPDQTVSASIAPHATSQPAASAATANEPPPRSMMGSILARLFPADAKPPTALECAGVTIGTIAAAVLALSHGDSSAAGTPSPSFIGDFIAFIGAVAMAFYLGVGSKLRKGLPLFLYAFPVTAVSAIASSVFSLAFEPEASLSGTHAASLFGWFGSGTRFGLTFAAAFGAGILGHTLCNYALGTISSLVVSVMLLLEPVVGSLMGYAAGVQGSVGAVTGVAGVFLLLGAALVTVGERGNVDALRERLWPRTSPPSVQTSSNVGAAVHTGHVSNGSGNVQPAAKGYSDEIACHVKA